jgi:hypothetical protein
MVEERRQKTAYSRQQKKQQKTEKFVQTGLTGISSAFPDERQKGSVLSYMEDDYVLNRNNESVFEMRVLVFTG